MKSEYIQTYHVTCFIKSCILGKISVYRKFLSISRDFFPHFQPCGLYSDMIYVVILYFFTYIT